MPPLERCALHQTAVLWPFIGFDSFGQPAVSAAEELAPGSQNGVRWEEGLSEVIDGDGATVAASDIVYVNQDITVGSTMRLGTLASVPSPATNLREVIDYKEVKDIKGRNIQRIVLLRRLKELPTVVSVVQRYSVTLTGDGATSSFTVTHSFGLSNKDDFVVDVKDENSIVVHPNVTAVDVNSVTVDFGYNVPDGDTFRVTILA